MAELFPETAERVKELALRPEVLGVIVVGSKSAGHADHLSDDDMEVILTEEAHALLSPAQCSEVLYAPEGDVRRIIYDAYYEPLSALAHKANSPRDLEHWPYERARVLFDRDGRVSEAVAAARVMTPEFRRARLLHATVDAWVAGRRAEKTFGRGAEAAAHLVIARGAKALSRILFALEWRWVPLDHWLEPELKTLDDAEGAGRLLVDALKGGAAQPLKEAVDALEDRLFAEGVPRPDERIALFLELIHPSREAERMVHGLY
ncbi:MAG TPA: hypothetical protein VKA70_06195 [Blastocatellia bacterium]|nr:hypothetical protein [Blastocatellia bacterium]